MKKNRVAALLGLAFGFAASGAIAQEISVGTDGAQPGGTATIPLTYTAGGDVASADATIDYDETILTPDLTNCGGTLGSDGHTVSCNDTGTAIQVLIVAPVTFPIPPAPSGSLGSIDFAIDAGATEGTSSPLDITMENYFDTSGNAVSPPTTAASRSGQVDILAAPVVMAMPTFSPSNGGQIAIGPLTPGGSGTNTVTFSDAQTDPASPGYTVSNCSVTGTAFSLSSTGVTVPGNGSASITITGTAPTDGTVPSETLTCDVDGTTDAYSIGVSIFLQPEEVPTLSQWALILLALGMAGIGFMSLRRRGSNIA